MQDRERLFVAQAFYNAVKEIVSTKDDGNLRDAVDDYYRKRYEEDGSKSFECRINGMKVGTYSIRTTKAKPATSEKVFGIKDPEMLMEWFKGMDSETVARYASDRLSDFAEWCFYRTGEIPGGCNVVEIGTPATVEQWAGGSLRIDQGAVAEALGSRLQDATRMLLEEGAKDDQ